MGQGKSTEEPANAGSVPPEDHIQGTDEPSDGLSGGNVPSSQPPPVVNEPPPPTDPPEKTVSVHRDTPPPEEPHTQEEHHQQPQKQPQTHQQQQHPGQRQPQEQREQQQQHLRQRPEHNYTSPAQRQPLAGPPPHPQPQRPQQQQRPEAMPPQYRGGHPHPVQAVHKVGPVSHGPHRMQHFATAPVHDHPPVISSQYPSLVYNPMHGWLWAVPCQDPNGQWMVQYFPWTGPTSPEVPPGAPDGSNAMRPAAFLPPMQHSNIHHRRRATVGGAQTGPWDVTVTPGPEGIDEQDVGDGVIASHDLSTAPPTDYSRESPAESMVETASGQPHGAAPADNAAVFPGEVPAASEVSSIDIFPQTRERGRGSSGDRVYPLGVAGESKDALSKRPKAVGGPVVEDWEDDPAELVPKMFKWYSDEPCEVFVSGSFVSYKYMFQLSLGGEKDKEGDKDKGENDNQEEPDTANDDSNTDHHTPVSTDTELEPSLAESVSGDDAMSSPARDIAGRKKLKYERIVPLPPGDHDYLFMVNGKWTVDVDSRRTNDGQRNKITVKNIVFERDVIKFVDSDDEASGDEAGIQDGGSLYTVGGIGAHMGTSADSSEDLSSSGASRSSRLAMSGPVPDTSVHSIIQARDAKLRKKGGPKYGTDPIPPDQLVQEPPRMPSMHHSSQIVMNSQPHPLQPEVLPLPRNVTVNHFLVYRPSAGDLSQGVLVSGLTRRFRTKPAISLTHKFVTTLYYRDTCVPEEE